MMDTRTPARTRDVAALAAFAALSAGAIEAAATAFRKIVLGRIAFVSDDYFWMTPAAFLIMVVPAMLVMHLAAKAVHRPLSPSLTAGTLTTVLVFSLLLPYTTIAWWASAALAVGAGMQIARRVARTDVDRLLTRLNRATVVLAAVIIVAGLSGRGVRAWQDRQPFEAPPRPAGAPNVLLIVLDTVRSANLGLYGYERPTTPNLDRWAAGATVFNRAIAPAPWTLPSHASMFTGRPAGDLNTSWKTPLSADPRTLAEALRARGYATSAFVSNLLYTSSESGLSRGFAHYDDYRLSLPLIFRHSSLSRFDVKSDLAQARSWQDAWRAIIHSHIAAGGLAAADMFRPADQIAQAFLGWQAGVASRPFFAFINFFDAHGPYRAPEQYLERFAGPTPSAEIGRYDAAIAFQDHVIDEILDTLRARGVLDHTIVVVTSDHGEHFGEHGLKGHANSLYLPLLHVPLFVRYPGFVPAGTRVDTLVSLRDLAATVADLAGVVDTNFPGASLADTWRQPGQPVFGDVGAELERGINIDPAFPNSRGDMATRFDERYHLIRDGDGKEELYDYRADPLQQRNLVDDAATQMDLRRLRARMPVR